jgi:uracil-DNA glycosylase family 4
MSRMEVVARNGELARFTAELRGCQKCALAMTRTQVVPGTGDPDANLMFVGEAPGYHEDQQGAPFVGQAGKLLDRLLGEIGLTRDQVFIANVLKCRPPGNRDPLPEEIEACEGHLFHQLDLIRPRVVCTLGNFATKLLSGQPYGITRVRGRPQRRRFGSLEVTLFPIYHPAAALYTPAMLETLRGDFARLPALLRSDGPEAIGAAGEAGAAAAGNGTRRTGFGWSPAGAMHPTASAGAGGPRPAEAEVGGEPEPAFAQLGLF